MEDFEKTRALAAAWEVGTTDIRDRVSAEIGSAPEEVALAGELRALRSELRELRLATGLLQVEILRLRQELAPRAVTRLAPYTPADGLVRLS